ncbi:Protein of uncharacterised function (DUF1194) [Pannonibacter phragmitetus]|uniref:Protein of uncharacterized function (DUF1194) n=1 Tax=Pannonibacter phragmitetus TaxID=121719 RepID=A0A378ZQU2_9HYPH|nr:DUF1194 domain-containing protein [Pannonibacter phragmitetus]SUA99622.1 Protein of uncharacterised function (DUF1194) [Pannonibacter phragmitetus]
MRLTLCKTGRDVCCAAIGSLAILAFTSITAFAERSLSGIFSTAYSADAEVDVELVLAVDISQSMDRDEQEVQRAGYVSALTSREVLAAIQDGPTGRIAITYFEWGGVGEHFMVAEWSIIQDEATAAAFAARIAEAPLRQVQRTSIFAALEKSADMIASNEYQGLRKVIDISGDGPNNQGGTVTQMRDKVIAAGVTINGLPLMMKSETSAWQAMLHLDHYYEDCVIGGPGAFAIPVRSKEAFAEAVRMKLVLEIAGLMENQPLIIPAAGRKSVSCNLFD